ncbi:MAG: glycosyltransferase [Gammaproteobacteria bacterium]|nr:MAG: glycosyltransferase [Gammaproteobacteria bacterium]
MYSLKNKRNLRNTTYDKCIKNILSPQIKVLHVVPTFYPATYFGGPVFSLYGLCNALSRMDGTELRVLTTDSNGPRWQDHLDIQSVPTRRPEGYEVYYCRKWWGREFSGQLLSMLYPMIRWADVVHLTSVYSFSTIPALLLCRLLRKPVVWSPRGALQRWEGSTKPILKRIWEIICNGLLSPSRCVLHVTSNDEAEESRRRITRARVEVVENGVDIPSNVSNHRSWMPGGALRLLFIGRLDPKKGIENLLQALKMLDERVSLTICGTGESSYESSLQALSNDLGLAQRACFSGHAEGEVKSRAFWNADVCVVPSYTENFAMVVAEALAHGVPVIASRGTPWKELTQRGCGLWVQNDPASLVKAIAEMRGLNLSQMGENGRQWMEESFSWEAVAGRTHAIYTRLIAETTS